MFSVQEYINDLVVTQDDEELTRALDLVALTDLICDDPWLARQAHYGLAGAMERQLEYIGSTLRVNAESRLTQMASSGVMGESYTADNWFGTTNEEKPHDNEEVAFDQQLEDKQNFIAQLDYRMRTAAIIMVTNIRAHDDISKDLNQLTYGGIKAKAQSNRAANEARRTG